MPGGLIGDAVALHVVIVSAVGDIVVIYLAVVKKIKNLDSNIKKKIWIGAWKA